MMMKIQTPLLALFILFATACTPKAEQTPVSLTPSETQKPLKRAQLYKEDDIEVVQGAFEAPALTATYDTNKHSMTLNGRAKLTPYDDGEAPLEFDLSLIGATGSPGTLTLRPSPGIHVPKGMKIAAKATCIGEDENTCEDSFIDIYISYKSRVYHHQIEVLSDKTKLLQKEVNSISPEHAEADSQQPAVVEEDDNTSTNLPLVRLDHDNDPIEDDDDVEEQTGRYIGDLKGDINNILHAEFTPLPIAPVDTTPSPKKDAKPSEQAPKDADKDVKKTAEKTPEKKTEERKEETQKKEPENKPLVPKPEVKPAPTKQEVVPTDPQPSASNEPRAEEPSTGNIDITKKIMQVIGFANRGRLQKGLSLQQYIETTENPGLYLSRPENGIFYGGNELIYLMVKIGKFTVQKIQDYSLRIGDLSKKNGGTIYTKYKGVSVPKHLSHKNGLDADMSYFFKDPKSQGQSVLNNGAARSDWLIDEQWELFKELTATKLVDRIFVHRNVKKALCRQALKSGELTKSMKEGLAYETLWRLQPRPHDHADHFHLRAKCSSLQQGCRASPEPRPGTGCF